MHRQERARRRAASSASSAFAGSEVNVAPRRVKRADLEHHEIERPEAFADRRVLVVSPVSPLKNTDACETER